MEIKNLIKPNKFKVGRVPAYIDIFDRVIFNPYRCDDNGFREYAGLHGTVIECGDWDLPLDTRLFTVIIDGCEEEVECFGFRLLLE